MLRLKEISIRPVKIIITKLFTSILVYTLLINSANAALDERKHNLTAQAAAVSLKVKDFGDKDTRKLLRYNFKPGQEETLNFQQIFSENKTYLGNIDHNLKININTKTIISAVHNNGEATIKFRINKVDVNYKSNMFTASKLKEIKDLFVLLEGVSGEYLISKQGHKTITKINANNHKNKAKIKDKIKQVLMLISQSIIFPQQPVGNGANWLVQQKVISEDGITASQTVAFTINEISGNKVKLTTLVSQHSDIKSLDWWLKTYSANGTGKLTLNLDSLIPISESKLDSKAEITHFGINLDLAQSMTINSGKI